MKAYTKYNEKKFFWKRCFQILKKHGFIFWFIYVYEYLYYLIKSPKYFCFNGKRIKCVWSWRSRTWNNEREVELALAAEKLKYFKSQRILEVGNVLNHYMQINHNVLDKYEKWDGIINKDIVSFNPCRKYDLIISISTLEHVGLDENPSVPEKIYPSFENMISLLSKKGKLFFTIPWDHNPSLKNLILKNRKKFSLSQFLIRRKNQWENMSFEDFEKSEQSIKQGLREKDVIFVGELSKEMFRSGDIKR